MTYPHVQRGEIGPPHPEHAFYCVWDGPGRREGPHHYHAFHRSGLLYDSKTEVVPEAHPHAVAIRAFQKTEAQMSLKEAVALVFFRLGQVLAASKEDETELNRALIALSRHFDEEEGR